MVFWRAVWMTALMVCSSCVKEKQSQPFEQSFLLPFDQLQKSDPTLITGRDQINLHLFDCSYSLNFDKLLTAEEGWKIPKKVHLIWLGPKTFPLESVENIRRWKNEHPNWKFKFWTDRDRLPPIAEMDVKLVDKSVFSKLAAQYDSSTSWVEKSAILRLEILAKEGGVYIDHDADCLRPFDPFHHGVEFYAALEPAHLPIDGMGLTLGMGVIGAAKGSPVILKALDLIEKQWQEMTNLFPVEDPFGVAQRVAYRTYIALTYAWLDSQQEGEIVLPSDYFYPKKEGSHSLFSKHYYGTSLNPYTRMTKAKKFYRMTSQLFDQEAVAVRVVAILGSFFVLLASTLFIYEMKKG